MTSASDFPQTVSNGSQMNFNWESLQKRTKEIRKKEVMGDKPSNIKLKTVLPI
jgi:hypothetical protein